MFFCDRDPRVAILDSIRHTVWGHVRSGHLACWFLLDRHAAPFAVLRSPQTRDLARSGSGDQDRGHWPAVLAGFRYDHLSLAVWCEGEVEDAAIRRMVLILQPARVDQFVNGDHLQHVQRRVVVDRLPTLKPRTGPWIARQEHGGFLRAL